MSEQRGAYAHGSIKQLIDHNPQEVIWKLEQLYVARNEQGVIVQVSETRPGDKINHSKG